MKKIKYTSIFVTLLLFSSCNRSLYKALNEIKDLPSPNYSFAIEPKYKDNQELAENKIKELYTAEKVKIGLFKTFEYEKETNKQINEKFWLHIVILNSQQLTDYKGDVAANKLAIDISKFLSNEIENFKDYNKIQVTFSRQWFDGNIKQEKRNIFLSLPDFIEINIE